MSNWLIFALGFFAQILFFARTILQWFKSEHEKEIISPVIFWQLSLVASILMLIYGILRNDFSVILGQLLVYYIYIRNLQLKNAWRILPKVIRILALIMPVLILIPLLYNDTYNFSTIFNNHEVASWLMIVGTVGQLIFTFRFIYQWIYSEREKESLLPLGFWIISVSGSLIIFVYSIFRRDPVLFLSHLLGLFVYVRNILIYYGKTGFLSKFENIPFMKKIFDKIGKKLN